MGEEAHTLKCIYRSWCGGDRVAGGLSDEEAGAVMVVMAVRG